MRGISPKARDICLQAKVFYFPNASMDERIFVIHFYCSRQFFINNNFFPLLEKPPKARGVSVYKRRKAKGLCLQKASLDERIFVSTIFTIPDNFPSTIFFFPCLKNLPKREGYLFSKRRENERLCLQNSVIG